MSTFAILGWALTWFILGFLTNAFLLKRWLSGLGIKQHLTMALDHLGTVAAMLKFYEKETGEPIPPEIAEMLGKIEELRKAVLR